MKLACLCFTERGEALAERLAAALPNGETNLSRGYGPQRVSLTAWTSQAFASAEALLYIGAAGIAVRAIAPHLHSKTTDPAVLVMDEAGQFVIPLLAGHIGGANRWARRLAELLGATPVLTTASDLRGLLPVDEWASVNGLTIHNPHQIKTVAARALRGDTVHFYSELPIRGALPAGWQIVETAGQADLLLSPALPPPQNNALWLIPPCIALGVGCRKDISAEAVEAAFAQALQEAQLAAAAVEGVYSIDLKEHEPGLLAACAARGWRLTSYSAGELAQVAGSVSPSGFVRRTVGVDNVCERSALAGGGYLRLAKMTLNGVTVALVQRQITYSFEEWL